jgi:hypothetical protein
MITNPDYNARLIGPPPPVSPNIAGLADYPNYVNYENAWLDYYNTIFHPNMDQSKQIRLFIAESAPNGIYPNPNYAFDLGTRANLLAYPRDAYLWNYFRGVFPASTTKITKEKALIMLSKQNILILDLLPTHGIQLERDERETLRCNPARFADLAKIKGLPNIPNKPFNYAFSVPPTSYAPGFLTPHLPTNFKEYGNVNTGQGFAPSQRAIQAIIAAGF